MDFFKNRMREPSTWVGLAMLLTQAASAVATKDPAAIGAAVAGVLGMVLPERKG